MDDENTGHLAVEQIDRQRRGGNIGGDNSDKRVTRAIDWVLAAIGSTMLIFTWRAGDALIDLKVNFATLTERLNSKDARDNAQDRRLDTLEEKTFRGVDGYGEPDRGR